VAEAAAPPRRGELRWVDWSPGRGSEQTGRRPAVVVQADAGNRASSYPNTVVVAVSSQGHEIPLHVRLRPSRQNGLRNVSFVKCEQIFTVSKERLGGRIGALTREELGRVERALCESLSLRWEEEG
jgi:mRNA interferase MazF